MTWVGCGRDGRWMGWVGAGLVAGMDRHWTGQRLSGFGGRVCVLWQELPRTVISSRYAQIFLALMRLPSTWVPFSRNFQPFQTKGVRIVSRWLQSAFMFDASIGSNCYLCVSPEDFLQRSICLVTQFLSAAQPAQIGIEPSIESLLINCGLKLYLQIREKTHP